MYPEIQYLVKNFKTFYSVYDKEEEDLILRECNKCSNNSITIDGNKLIIGNNWNNGITDEIVYLILTYKIDIFIVKKYCFNYEIPNYLI